MDFTRTMIACMIMIVLLVLVAFVFSGDAASLWSSPTKSSENTKISMETIGMLGIYNVYRFYDPSSGATCYVYEKSGIISCSQ